LIFGIFISKSLEALQMTAVMIDNSSSFVVPLVDLVYNAQFFFFFFWNFYFKMSSSIANETSYDWKLDFVPCSSMPWLISSTMRKKNCSWCPKGHDEKHGWDGLFAPFFGLILLHTLCTRIRQCPSHSALATTFFVTLLVAAILSFNDNCTPAELPRPACRQNIFSTFVNPITVKNYLIAGFFDNEGPEECSSWQVNNSILGANGPHLKQYVAPYHVHAVMYQWQPKSRFPLEFCAHCLKWHNNIPLDPLYFAKW